VLTYLAALALAVAPGAILGLALPAGRYRWTVWAASPSVTLGLAAVAMGWMPRAGLPDSPRAVLVGELVLAVLGVAGAQVAGRLRSRHRAGATPDHVPARPAPPPGPRQPAALVGRLLHRWGLPRLVDLVCVAVPSLFTVAFGYVFLGKIAQPPGWDGMNHAFFTRRMIDAASTATEAVCVTGSTHIEPSCAFYPLAADTLWAQTAELTGGRVGTAMLGWAIVVGPLAMVAGVYAATRLLGGRPLVALCAAAMPTLLGPLWISLRTGRITEQAAPCMAAGVALLVALALRGRHPLRIGVLAAVSGIGIVMSHSYDVLFMGTLALVIVTVLHERFSVRRMGIGLATMAVTAVLGLLPFFGVILGANAERTANDPVYRTLGESFQFWVQDFDRYVLFGFPPPGTRNSVLDVPTISIALWVTLVVLCASPLCFVLRPLRWARPWVATGLIWTAIGIWTSYSTSPVALALWGLWYGIRERVRNMIMPVYGLTALAGACAIAIVLWWLATRLVRRLRAGRVSAGHASAAGAVVLVCALTALAVPQSSWAPLRKDLLSRSPVGQSYTRTFVWLQLNTDPDAVVAYDRHLEFMTWSYADYDTGLLFGIPPLEKSSLANYDDRWAAFDWLDDHKDAKPAGCLVRKFNIEYLAVGQRRMPAWSANYSRPRLAASDKVELVHQEGKLRVFKVTDAGRSCPGAA
jgi:hypothetical protein